VRSADQRDAIAKRFRVVYALALKGDTYAAETLWLAFESLARRLAMLIDSKKQQHLRNYGILRAVLKRSLYQLKIGLERSENEALEAMYHLTDQACRLLKITAENAPEFVAVFAERCAFWPVMELQRIWPLNEENRKAKIEQFAKEYGFRLVVYRKGVCAIFEKELPSAPREVMGNHR
jgi:hypothetical protein